MISINNVNVSFGGFTLLNDINFHITDNDRIGLVGKNGAGKSTLLKLILGLNSPTSGKIMVPPGLTLGYLPQQMEHARDKSVIDEALTAFNELFELHEKIEKITALLPGANCGGCGYADSRLVRSKAGGSRNNSPDNGKPPVGHKYFGR